MSGDQADGTGACNWSGACGWSWSSGGEERESGGEEAGGELHSDSRDVQGFFECLYGKVNCSREFRYWRCWRGQSE